MKLLTKSFLTIFCLSIFSFSHAGQDDKLNGWAWSSNVGWISFNCTNTNSCGIVDYGVDVDSSGNLSGYAWSSNVGWIDFSGVTYNSVNGALNGDANFISADTEVDGWDDGTLRMSDTSPVSYGPVLNSSTDIFEGYAWGSEVVGWVNFNTAYGSVKLDPFTFTFTSDSGLTPADAVEAYGDVNLSWVTDGSVTSCAATGGAGTTWTDVATKPTDGAENVANLPGDIIFSLTCFNGSGKSITRNLPIYVLNPEPSITLTAVDTEIRSGEDAEILWTVRDADTCTASGSWSGIKSSSGGSETISGLTNLENIFALSCTSPYPEYPGDYTVFLTVFVDKLIINFERVVALGENPESGRFGEPVELSYLVENPVQCIVLNDLVTVGSKASSTLTISDYDPYITSNFGTTGFNSANGDITYTYETVPLFSADESQKTEYNFTIYCTGADSQTATSTVRVSVGRNPNFDER